MFRNIRIANSDAGKNMINYNHISLDFFLENILHFKLDKTIKQ